MTIEKLPGGRDAVNEDGDVVHAHDVIDGFFDEQSFEDDLGYNNEPTLRAEPHLVEQLGDSAISLAMRRASIEKSVRSHPSSHDMEEEPLGELARDIIANFSREAKSSGRKPPIKKPMYLVAKNWSSMSDTDRRAIAVAVGLAPDTFEKDDVASQQSSSSSSTAHRTIEEEQGFTDFRKAAANDRD